MTTYKREFEPKVRIIERVARGEAVSAEEVLKADQKVWDNLRCVPCEKMGRRHSLGPRPSGIKGV